MTDSLPTGILETNKPDYSGDLCVYPGYLSTRKNSSDQKCIMLQFTGTNRDLTQISLCLKSAQLGTLCASAAWQVPLLGMPGRGAALRTAQSLAPTSATEDCHLERLKAKARTARLLQLQYMSLHCGTSPS